MDTSAGTGADAAATEPSPADHEEGWRAWVLPGVLLVLLVLVLGTSLTLYLDRDQAAPPAAPRAADVGSDGALGRGPGAAAVDVARQAARLYYSLDHRHLQADVDAMTPLASVRFRTAYVAQVATLRQRVLREGLVLTATLPPGGTATEFVADGAARVLVAVDATTTSQAGSATGTTHYRTRVTLTRDGDRWLVASLDEVE